ncbi:MAG TPA: O-antigen ligase family protein [Balneolales bacterium]|nr:O-antigen ligase family protein [Balneolales bacterium]
MFEIIKDNGVFYLVFLPILIISSVIVPVSAIAVLIIGSFYFVHKERYDYIITVFILIIVLGDNLWPELEVYSVLRVVELILISIFSSIIIFRYDKGIDRRILFFIPFFFVGLISSYLYSPDMAASVSRAISYFLLVFSVFTYFRFVYQEYQQILYENIFIIITLIFIISILGIATPYHDLFFFSNRLRGLFGNPNSMALFSIFSYPIIDYFNYPDSKITQRQIKWVKILIIGSVILTGSRNGMVSIFIYYLLRNYYMRGVTGRIYSIIIGIGIVLIFFNIQLLTNYPPVQEFFRTESIQTASGRTQVWNVAVDQIKESPWMGNGDYYYQIFFQNYKRIHNLAARYWNSVWNSYLAILMDTGIIGLLAYIFFLFGLVSFTNNFKILIPFIGVTLFSAIFESWMVSSLNAYTTLFLFYFIIVYNDNSQ